MTQAGSAPGKDEFELALFGPGYGESIVMHVGGGDWVVVDSFTNSDGEPFSLAYLESIGVDPASAVKAIVATHWHDDHIRGIARTLKSCPAARFCCASALCGREFLAFVGARERRHFSRAGSGVRELFATFSFLHERGQTAIHAIADRRVFQVGPCSIWSLSPGDAAFERFLHSLPHLMPEVGDDKRRVRDLSPNDVAVALWVEVGRARLLLGADLERRGWVPIVQSEARPDGRASVVKVPHHGSRGADEPLVWERTLEQHPFAVLTPWYRGGHSLPTVADADRIAGRTPNAWVTGSARPAGGTFRHRNKAVEKTVRESNVRIRRVGVWNIVRLRRRIDSDGPWRVTTMGDARVLVA